MSLLGGAHYDPAGTVSKATSSLLAMTAFDTSNLRVTFTAPASGNVYVRLHGATTGAATVPALLVGVLDGATVRARSAAIWGRAINAGAAPNEWTGGGLVTGLTAGQSYTWDAAYAVQTVVASTNIKYGGPDDNTNTNAYGGLSFEVWSAETLLAGTHYDPGTQATASVGTLIAMTAFDTTNLRLTFTGPASGNVLVQMRASIHGSTAVSYALFGVLQGATVRARTRPRANWGVSAAILATDYMVNESRTIVTGLTPGTSYTWDAAYGVESVGASAVFAWGGPDTNAGDNAAGGFTYAIWDASRTPQAIPQVI